MKEEESKQIKLDTPKNSLMDRLDTDELKEWSQHQPLSILRLDPIDRAILKISGKCSIFVFSARSHSGNSLIITLLCKVLLRPPLFFSVLRGFAGFPLASIYMQSRETRQQTPRKEFRARGEDEKHNNKMRVDEKSITNVDLLCWLVVVAFLWDFPTPSSSAGSSYVFALFSSASCSLAA